MLIILFYFLGMFLLEHFFPGIPANMTCWGGFAGAALCFCLLYHRRKNSLLYKDNLKLLAVACLYITIGSYVLFKISSGPVMTYIFFIGIVIVINGERIFKRYIEGLRIFNMFFFYSAAFAIFLFFGKNDLSSYWTTLYFIAIAFAEIYVYDQFIYERTDQDIDRQNALQFAVFAKLAMVDHRKIDPEIAFLNENYFQNPEIDLTVRDRLSETFYENLANDETVEITVKKFIRKCYHNRDQVNFADYLFYFCAFCSLHGKPVHIQQYQILQYIAREFKIDAARVDDFINEYIREYHNQSEWEMVAVDPSLDDCYDILQCHPEVDYPALKRAYRNCVKQIHPDIIQAQGGNSERIKMANREFQRITDAFLKIKQSRNW